MKKTTTKILLLFSSLLTCSLVAQEEVVIPNVLPNADFSLKTENTDGTTTYNNWTGNGTTATDPDFTNPAVLKSYVKSTTTQGVCISYDKATGRCLQYSYSTTYNPVNQYIQQTFTLNSAPTKLYGKYKFSGTAGLSAQISVNGIYNGNNISGYLTLNSTTSNSFEIPINVTEICITKKCPNQLTITIYSCESTCPSASTPTAQTQLIIDDLSFTPSLTTGITDENNLDKSIYPNPVKDVLFVNSATKIYDLLGNLVTEGTEKIDVSGLANGVYVAKSETTTKKIVKE